MINSVRNTVLSILNKNNYGYISPSDFNLFAKQAQLDIFENYFYEYNYQINKENARASGTEYADIRKGYEEVIDTFSETKGLVNQVLNKYYTPSDTTTGDDYYLINKVLVYKDFLVSGITTSIVGGGNQVIDSTATFTSTVSQGDIVAVENGGVQYVTVVNVVSDTTLLVTGSFFDSSPKPYTIFQKGTKFSEAERVSHSKITMLNNSSLISPSIMFPAYTLEGESLDIYPDTVNIVGRVQSQYVRYPRDPKWTYVTLIGGEPSFDQSQPDFQDFELPISDEPTLVLKILQYAGMSIRELQAVQFGQGLEQKEDQEEK
jgi:hypothetical protein